MHIGANRGGLGPPDFGQIPHTFTLQPPITSITLWSEIITLYANMWSV